MLNGSDFKKNRSLRRNWITYSIKSAINLNVFELKVDCEHRSLTRAVNGEIMITLPIRAGSCDGSISIFRFGRSLDQGSDRQWPG
jgi:hypothetical protein